MLIGKILLDARHIRTLKYSYRKGEPNMPNIVCRILLKFVEADAATPDEVEAIREARQEIERGELFSHEDVWA